MQLWQKQVWRVHALQEDLDQAKSRIKELEEELKKYESSSYSHVSSDDGRTKWNQCRRVQSNSKTGRRSFSDVVKSKAIQTANFSDPQQGATVPPEESLPAEHPISSRQSQKDNRKYHSKSQSNAIKFNSINFKS